MKLKTTKMIVVTGLLAGAFIVLPQDASASLVASDGFEDYTEGGLAGENGGSGDWAGAWSAVSSTEVVSGGLNYSNGDVVINGGSKALSVNTTDNQVFIREFDTAGLGNEIYFSYLVDTSGTTASNFFNMSLTTGTLSGSDTNKDSPGQIGDLNTGAYEFGARMNRNSGIQDMATTYDPNQTYLLVGRISTDGTSDSTGANFDQVELWVNPSSMTPGAADALVDSNSTNAAVGSITHLGMRTAVWSSGDTLLLDEFRIGSSFSSVIPEPASLALVGLGGLLMLRRKRA